MDTPYVTIVRSAVPSTQDLAAAEMERLGRPVLVIAAQQTAGRGRSGNEWWQAPRGVAASLALASSEIRITETFPLSVGLAIRDALLAISETVVQLKWPNDIELAGRKVGGILVERSDDRVVVGCGLNLYWPEPPTSAGGLFAADPGPELGVDISKAWASALVEFDGRWNRRAYVAASSTIGAEVTWLPDGRGKALTVDERGGLVVDTADGPVTLRSGEVQTIRRISGDA